MALRSLRTTRFDVVFCPWFTEGARLADESAILSIYDSPDVKKAPDDPRSVRSSSATQNATRRESWRPSITC